MAAMIVTVMSTQLGWFPEAYRCLVALPVFKTGEAEHLGLASSIPVRLRQHPGNRMDVDRDYPVWVHPVSLPNLGSAR